MVAALHEEHPLMAGVRQIGAMLDGMAPDAWDGLEAPAVRAAIGEIARIESRLSAHKAAAARVLDASGAARRAGATSTGDLLARDFGGDRAAGDRLVRTAKRLQQSTATQQALSSGEVSFDQARAIGDGLDRLPERVTDDQRRMAEKRLLRDARHLNLKDLRRRADRAADAFSSPEETDRIENETLAQREKRAWANSSFAMWDKRDGTWEGRFRVPEAQAEMLKTAVDAIAAPRRIHLQDEPAPIGDTANRNGRAFAELCSHLPPEELPTAGGVGATVVVTMVHETLLEKLKPATLSTGARLSASQARQMACNLGIIPAVLGGQSQTLDLGRTARLHSRAQRIAIGLRDGGCTFPSCDRPPGWSEIHHPQPWSEGGRTDLTGVMLCPHHHRHIHTDGWRVRHRDGHVEWQRPGDPTWRRNGRWRA